MALKKAAKEYIYKPLIILTILSLVRSFGAVPLDQTAKRQLRQDQQLATEADYCIILSRAEKLHPGIYTFLTGDPQQNVSRIQANLEWL